MDCWLVLFHLCCIGIILAETNHNITVCENQKQEMKCPTGTYLQIDSFFYGRKDNITCPDPNSDSHLRQTNCSTPPGSLEKLQKYCNGRQSCYLIPAWEQWGENPNEPQCNGVYREAIVEYTCKTCVNSANESECESIRNTGVPDLEKCFKTFTRCDTANCGNTYSTSPNISHMCDQWAMRKREDCTFMDPGFMMGSCKESCRVCPDSSPAQITSIVAMKPVEVSICQEEITRLTCPNDTYLLIESFFYGRKDHLTCPDKKHGTHLKQSACSTPPGSVEKLQKICNGRNGCYFRAGTAMWGNNAAEPQCNGVFREAIVQYTCIACANNKSDTECESLKSLGKCATDLETRRLCFKTCTDCGSNDCGNEHDSRVPSNGDTYCDEYAMWAREECDFAPGFMLGSCKETCHACSGKCLICKEVTTTTPAPTTTMTTTAPAPTTTVTTTTSAPVSNITSAPVFSLSKGWHGRVEVVYNGVKGTVCDDTWSGENCKVLCKQLKYGGGVATVQSNDGPGTGQIWLDHVVCYGTETSLADCKHNGWGVHNCDHSEDAGCICDQPGGNTNTGQGSAVTVSLSHGWYGRVEVAYNNQLGTVCDDAWTEEDCKVVCKQLSYTGGKPFCCAQYGEGTGPIWLDHVQCDGTETNIGSCSHGQWGVHNCKHSEDVSCACDNPSGGGNVVITP